MRRRLLRGLGATVLALGILLGPVQGLRAETTTETGEQTRQEIPFVPETEEARTRYFSGIDSLQESCSNDLETSVIFNMETGEWRNIAVAATSRTVVKDGKWVREIGSEDEVTLARICHCHIEFEDYAARDLDIKHESAQSIANRFTAHIPSPQDIKSAIQQYGDFFINRDAPGEVDFCIVPTSRRSSLTLSQRILVYDLPEDIERHAKGIAKNISTPGNEQFVNTQSAHGETGVVTGDEVFNSLSIYGSSKAEEYADAMRPHLPKNDTKIEFAASLMAMQRARGAVSDYVSITESPLEGDHKREFKDYLRAKKEGFIPVLETADGPQLYKPCDGEPPVFLGLNRDQIRWVYRGVEFKTNGDMDLDGDGLLDIMAVKATPPRVLESCGLTDDWERKQIQWAIRYGDGTTAQGYYEGHLPYEVNGGPGGELLVVSEDFSGDMYHKVIVPEKVKISG